MKIECPACSASGTINESKMADAGSEVTCPRCGKRFNVRRERTGVEIIQQRERMTCPKCGCEQPLLETCAICGIVIKNYLQTQVRQQEKERLEYVKLRTATRDVDAWYSNLFDRQLSTLLVRVLSLLVLLGVFMTCSVNSAKRNRLHAENGAGMGKTTERNTVASPERNDAVFRDRFSTVVDLMTANTDACLGQLYNYKTSWQHNSQPNFLTENLSDSLERINMQHREVKSAVTSLPTPSNKYYACYVKLKELSHQNRQVCGMANAYTTYFHDFNERVSNFNFEFNRIRADLHECKNTIN